MKICLKCSDVFGGYSYENFCRKCGAILISDTKKNIELLDKKKLVLGELLDYFFENRNEFVINIDLAFMNVEIEQSLIRITLNNEFKLIQSKREEEKK